MLPKAAARHHVRKGKPEESIMRKRVSVSFVVCFALFACTFKAHGGPITTTFFFTTSPASPDVFSDTLTYDSLAHTFSLGSATTIGTSTIGADGIVFGPSVAGKQTLFFGGEGDQTVYQIPTTGGPALAAANAGSTAFLLTVNPAGNVVYTADAAGKLDTLPIVGGIVGAGTAHSPTGSDPNVAQIAFAPFGTYYITGLPGVNGNLGTINTTTFATARLSTNIPTAQGILYDPFTGLITLFGQGQVGTLNSANTLTTGGASLFGCGADTFTQGSVDAAGHALIIGCGSLAFIDYSGSHNILTPDFQTVLPFAANGKDVLITAGLTGPVGAVPEPSTMVLMSAGVAILALRRRLARACKTNLRRGTTRSLRAPC